MTWGFSSAKVSLVPESARRPGPGNRVARRTPPGDPRAMTSSAHEAEAGPDGARNHSLWVPSRRATGGHGHRVTGPRPREHPNCSRMPRFGGVTIRWHGLPGQRERRREATEPACRQTGPRLRQRGPVRRAAWSGRHSGRGTGGNARAQRGRVADRPGAQLRDRGRSAGPRLGVAANIGRPMDGVERQRIRATGSTAENGHRPPDLRVRRAM